MAPKRKQILPFRIPFFRIFYSTTYTIVLIITLCFLAITPGTALVEAIQAGALQYVFIIGGVYVITAIIAIFIYTSRLYTNRIVLAAVGKAYIPIEPDEIGKKIRAMIVSQLNRSAVVSWEAKPRDVKGEVLYAEKEGLLPEPHSEKSSLDGHLGSIVPVNINSPPWGDIQHRGWTAPSLAPADYPSSLHFDVVIAELPHLLEAKAVGLAPESTQDGLAEPDPRIVELLRRQERAGLREYLTQLSYLGVVNMTGSGASFMALYEHARFSGVPPTYEEFKRLMTAFAVVLEQMTALDPAIIIEIRQQFQPTRHNDLVADSNLRHNLLSTPEPNFDAVSSLGGISPVTAQTRQATPYLTQANSSQESMASILHNAAATPHLHGEANRSSTDISLSSDAVSVLRHDS